MSSETLTRGRRSRQVAPNAPRVSVGTAGFDHERTYDELDHGLNDAEYVYAWANKLDPRDMNEKLRMGWQFTKYEDVKARLAERAGNPYALREDVSGNVIFGADLVLMHNRREYLNRWLVEAMRAQQSTVADATSSDFANRLEDFLIEKSVPVKKAPRIYQDNDHGQTLSMEVKEN